MYLMSPLYLTTDTEYYKLVTWKLLGPHIATPREPVGNAVIGSSRQDHQSMLKGEEELKYKSMNAG
jgi:hypothetical protein